MGVTRAGGLVCRICFEPAHDEQRQARVTACGHVFCGPCALQWFQTDSTCPVCRRPLVTHAELITVFDDQQAGEGGGEVGEAGDGAGGGGGQGGGGEAELHVQATLQSLSKRWQRMAIERAKLHSRVGGLEDENRSLKEQLERALDENRHLQRLVLVGGAGEGGVREGGGAGGERDPEEGTLGSRWEEAGHFDVHQEPIHGIAVHQGSEPLVATASWDHSCLIFDLAQNGKVVQELSGHEQGLYSVQFAPPSIDANLVGTVSSDMTARLWSCITGENLATLVGHTGEVNGLSFCGVRKLAATASDDWTGVVWDVVTAKSVQVLRGHEKEVYGIAWHPDGRMVATVSFDQCTRLWDPRSGEAIRRLEGHTDDVIGVDLDASGTLLATGSDDTTALLWDTRTWKTIAVLKDHLGEVKRVRFSPRGRMLATTSGDATIRLFDTRTFANLAVLQGHTDHVFDCGWGSASDFLVSGSHDRTWKLWRPK